MGGVKFKKEAIKLRRIVSIICCLVILSGLSPIAAAEGFKDPLSYPFYDPGSSACDVSGSGNRGNSNAVYVIGDSLTVGMDHESLGARSLSGLLTANGWRPSVNAKSGRAVYNEISDSIPSAFDDYETDRTTISQAGAIIIALGTNNLEGDEEVFVTRAKEYIDMLRDASPMIGDKIYWVNTHTSGGGKSERATSIAQVVEQEGIQLIDYRAAVTATPDTYPYERDGTHNTSEGYVNKALLVANALGKPTSVSYVSSGGSYDPLSMIYPKFPDEAAIVAGMQRTIQERNSGSPWLGLEQWILDTSKLNNVNPLFIFASGGVESAFGNSKWGRQNNNYFGIDQGHRSFPSPQAGIQYFIESIPRYLSGDGAGGRYADAKNIYEYFSIHQSGSIVYPGQPFDPNDIDSKPGVTQDLWDPTMDVWVSWDETANLRDGVNSKYRGNVYNPLAYYKMNIEIINQATGLNLPTEPGGPGSTSNTNCGDNLGAGANGWDLPGEGDHPMAYFSQLRESSAPDDSAVQGYYGDFPYGSGTIAGCGCGPTSWAMIVTTLTGNKVEPTEVANWAAENGFRTNDDACAGSVWWWTSNAAQSEQKWGVRAREISITDAPAELRKGNLIMTSVGNGSPLLSRGGNGHLLVMRAVTDDGKFLFADPSDGTTKRNNGGDGSNPDIFKEYGSSSRTPLDSAVLSSGLKALFVVEKI